MGTMGRRMAMGEDKQQGGGWQERQQQGRGMAETTTMAVRATPKSNSVDNVRALQGDATVLEKTIKL